MEVERGRFVFIDLYSKINQKGRGRKLYVTLWSFVTRIIVSMSGGNCGAFGSCGCCRGAKLHSTAHARHGVLRLNVGA
jgi:hypothetical protein